MHRLPEIEGVQASTRPTSIQPENSLRFKVWEQKLQGGRIWNQMDTKASYGLLYINLATMSFAVTTERNTMYSRVSYRAWPDSLRDQQL